MKTLKFTTWTCLWIFIASLHLFGGNAMAIELGIPKDVAGAASLLTREQVIVRNVDLGQVGERYFILRLCTGYEPEYVKETTRETKERLGSLAYGLSMVKQELKQVSYQLTLDGEEVEVTGYSCMVANSGNFGLSDYPILSNISVSDGLLDVVIVQNLDFLSMLRDRNRTDEQHQFIRHWQAREATIATETPQTVVGDGEIWGDTPFTARVVPSAVRIIVP